MDLSLQSISEESSGDSGKDDQETENVATANLIADDDREEGEIVSDNDITISSDEEISMIQRIKELEAKNEELEKIATISTGYDHTNYYRNFGAEVFESSFQSPLTLGHRTTRRRTPPSRRLVPEASFWFSDDLPDKRITRSRKNKYYSKKTTTCQPKYATKINYDSHWQFEPRKRRRKKRRNTVLKMERIKSPETELIDSYSDDDGTIFEEHSDNSIKDKNSINRENLRFALAHTSKKRIECVTLKERLLREQSRRSSKDEDIQSLNSQNKENEENSSPEEQELRLIALRSAVINKHLARKKRDAEKAYSPTDFDELFGDNLDSYDMKDVGAINDDLEDLECTMDISPVNSPKLLLSSNEDHDHHSSMDSIYAVDTKPIDMDIANSDSENEVQVVAEHKNVWPTIGLDLIPLNMNSENTCELMNYEAPIDYSIHKFHSSQNSSHLNGYENATLPFSAFGMCVQPEEEHPNYFSDRGIEYSTPIDMALSKHEENEDTTSESENRKENTSSCQSDSNIKCDTDEEEAEALRALLLSKICGQKRISNVSKQKSNLENVAANEAHSRYELKADASHIVGQRRSAQTSILKDAVRRLKRQYEHSFPVDSKIIPNNIEQDHTKINVSAKRRNYLSTGNNAYHRSNIIAISGNVAIENSNRALRDNANQNAPPDVITTKGTEHCASIDKDEQIVNNYESESIKPHEDRSEKKDCSSNLSATIAEPTECFPTTSSDVTKTSEPKIDVPRENVKDKFISTASLHPTAKINTKIATSVLKPKTTQMYPVAKKPIPVRNKIVKPNKVINGIVKINQERTKQPESGNRVLTVTKNIIQSKTADTRLLTKTNKPAMAVKKLVISLRASDTDSTEDEKDCVEETEINKKRENILEKLSFSVKNNYYEKSSLPTTTPTRSPTTSCASVGEKSANESANNLEQFEQKLDDFLKTMRSQVEEHAADKQEITAPSTKTVKNVATPVAVRHLPAAFQKEYRHLIHRMKMLEKQKCSKKAPLPQKTDPNVSSKQSVIKERNVVSNNGTLLITHPNYIRRTPTDSELSIADVNSVPNTLESTGVVTVPAVCLKQTKTNQPLNEQTTAISNTQGASNNSNTNESTLSSYENLFLKIGSHIVSNLNKSLNMVEEAKNIKRAKLCCEKELNELCKKIDALKNEINLQGQKMSQIIPTIRNSNELITSLKLRRSKLFRMANTLGKDIKGEDYRLNDDNKKEIVQKSRRLAQEIRNVNSLKCDSSKGEEVFQSNISKSGIEVAEQHATENKELESPELTDVTDIPSTTAESAINTGGEQNSVIPAEVIAPQLSDIYTQSTEGCPSYSNKEKIEEDAIEQHDTSSSMCCQRKILDSSEVANPSKQKPLDDYVSPLEHCRRSNSNLDPNCMICPFEFWGVCSDTTCIYLHLSQKIPDTS